MAFRMLLRLAAVLSFLYVWPSLSEMEIPHDAKSFAECLKNLRRKPGQMGYFNSNYMAFTLEETNNFPNLVSFHSRMRRRKADIDDSLNNTQTTTRSKRSTSYPSTKISGPCSTTIGGLQRLCEVCPAVTDLGPDRIPQFINEVMCADSEGDCSVEGVSAGKCQEATVVQDFLFLQESTFQVYSQEIRICCTCGLL